ncbi:MAG: hypothetical protein SFV19_07470 [Rhodospirillaceae bacterium]|nr:hypothetical protein [Rhodospirillaceae bacterium]
MSNVKTILVFCGLLIVVFGALIALFVVFEPEDEAAGLAAVIVSFLGMFLYQSAMTVLVSDSVVGHESGVARTLKFVLPRIHKILAVGILQAIIVLLGMLVLLIPGLFAATRLNLAIPVATLENPSIMQSLRRSAELGRGFYWRNLGITALWVLPLQLLPQVAVFAAMEVGEDSLVLLGNVLQILLMPLQMAIPVLLYYEMRVRKEAFDATIIVNLLDH